MSLDLDTVEEKKAKMESEMEAATEQTISSSGVWFTTLIISVLAGMSHVFDLLVVKALKNALLSTCTSLELINANWARWGRVERQPATAYLLDVSSTGTPNETLPGGVNGMQFINEQGVKYFFPESVLIPATGIITTVVQAFKTGVSGYMDSGILTAVQQNVFLSGDGLTVTGVNTEAIAEESFEVYKAEVQRSMQEPILADNYSYYWNMTRGLPSMAAGYAYVDAPGTMELYAESKNENLYGVPTDEEIEDLKTYIQGDEDGIVKVGLDLMEFRPDGVTPRLKVLKSQPTDFYVIIYGMAEVARRPFIETEVRKYFPTRKPYIKGQSANNAGTLSQGDLRSRVQGGLDKSGGGTYNEVVLYIAATDTAVGEYPLGRGERSFLPAIDGIRWA